MEFVWVVRRGDLFPFATPHGFEPAVSDSEVRQLASRLTRIRERAFFVERRFAESDPSLKQIIPYCVVIAEDRCLRLQRLATQGERRLHHALSIGIGGHINPVDAEDGDPLDRGTERELDEELHLDGPFERRIIGTVNDDTTEVGAVHFGVVSLVRVGSGQARVRESQKMHGELVAIDSLIADWRRDPERYESWSSFVLAQLGNLA
ncbi:MAG: hypothetical protein RL885_24190 [Planctomycetota bacterium]